MIVLGLDVDGTLVSSAYPELGDDLGAVPWLRRALEENPDLRIMLCTMRSGALLHDAEAWLESRGIPVWASNHNPGQARWTTSPKPNANLYVDDRAVGTPLREDQCVDWARLGPMLLERLARYRTRGGDGIVAASR